MNAVRFHRFVVVALLGVILVSAEVTLGQQNTQPQDLMEGANLIFKPPQNPPIRPRKNQQENKSKAVGSPQTNDHLSDNVEDALALGNAARDRRPPDFASAEKAYRLAWKLSPNDPRSYVGLGNVYFDQQRYPEAAKSYKDAIRLKEMRGAALDPPNTRAINVESAGQTGAWHDYLAMAMLRQENLTGAELELRRAVAIDSKNATWRAQLAYALFAQKRFTEAAASYKSAFELDPNNDNYSELLRQSLLKARLASAQDDAIAKRMESTKWEIREDISGNIKGTCRLTTGQRLDCTLNGNKRSPYDGMRWKIQDGLFELERAFNSAPNALPTLPQPSCIGEMRADRIYIQCPLPQIERAEVWAKQDRD